MQAELFIARILCKLAAFNGTRANRSASSPIARNNSLNRDTFRQFRRDVEIDQALLPRCNQ
jgi:hypothetical protein